MNKANGRPLVLLSHGYENIYERGFCNGLSDAGFDFTLISSDRTDYKGLRPGTKTVNLRGSQEESRSKWQKLWNLVGYHARLVSFALRHRESVFHLIGLIEPAWLCGVLHGLVLRLFCHRWVITVHDLLPHDRDTPGNRLLFGISYRLADHLVVHTPRMRAELQERYSIPTERFTLMEHGLEPVRIALPPLATYRAPEPLKLLFFGYVMKYKGLDLLIDALRDFPVPFTLTVGGFCRAPEILDELKAKIDGHPQRDSIYWPNQYVKESEIQGLFTDSHVLVMPYRHIDQSGVLFQALRFGLPVVASRVGSLAQYVTPEVGEVCEPDNIADLRAALLRLAQRYGSIDREQVGMAGRKYEWQNTVGALENAYQ